MLISVTIVSCTSFIASTLFYIGKKHILLEQEKERTKEEKIGKSLDHRIFGSFTLYFFILMPLFTLVLTLLIFWGYEIFNWLIINK